MISCAIFDLDGTLIDSRLDIADAFHVAADAAGLHRPPVEAIAPHIGLPLADMFVALWGGLEEAQLDTLAQTYRAYYSENLANRTLPYPGAEEMLLGLRPMRLGIATTKCTWMAELAMRKVRLMPLVDHVQGTDDFPAKPSPDVLLRAAEALSVPSRDCIYAGDGTWDMEAATRASMTPIGVAHGGIGADKLRRAGAARVVESLGELTAVIRELYQSTM